MKKFLFHVLICLAALLVINAVYLFTVNGLLRRYEEKYLDFQPGFSTLVLGDSHSNRAWAANEDSGLYNFSFGSDNVTDMSWKLSYAITHSEPKPGKHLILSFDPHLISKYRETKNNNQMNELINKSWVDKRVLYFLPLFFDRNTELDTKRYLLGYGGEEEDGKVREMTKKSIVGRMRMQYPDEGASMELMQTYQRLIDNARSNGYIIEAVQYPLHPYYDSLMQHHAPAIRLSHLMDSLGLANNLNIRRFSKFIPEEKYYLDQDHVNKNGSRLFIDLFKSETHP
jgi:hypothetical protein